VTQTEGSYAIPVAGTTTARRDLVAALVSACALSLVLRRLALQIPDLGDAIATALSSVVVLAVLWAVKEEAKAAGTPLRLLRATLAGRSFFWLPVVAVLLAFTPVMTIRCEDDGALSLSLPGGVEASSTPLVCRAGTTQVSSFVGWVPEVTAVDGADRRQARRALRPFATNELRFPADFMAPLQVLIALDAASAGSLADIDRARSGVARGCDAKESLFCLTVEGVGAYPLGRRPLLLGGRAAAPKLLGLWREAKQGDRDAPMPYAIAPAREVRPGQTMRAQLAKYDVVSGRFASCATLEYVPARGEENLWEIDAQALCS